MSAGTDYELKDLRYRVARLEELVGQYGASLDALTAAAAARTVAETIRRPDDTSTGLVEIIAWTMNRRHLVPAETTRPGWGSGPALCSGNVTGATIEQAATRINRVYFKATPMCRKCEKSAGSQR